MNNGLLGAAKASGMSLTPGAGQQQQPEMAMPKVGDKILLQAYPFGMINVYDSENGTPAPQATYIEVEVKSLKKIKVTYEDEATNSSTL